MIMKMVTMMIDNFRNFHLIAKLDSLLDMGDWEDEVLNNKPIVDLGVNTNI